MKILFTGGGTGGHLFPVIAIAREIKRLSDDPKIQLHYIGPSDQLGALLLAQENIHVHNIVAGKIRRYFSLENILDIGFKIPFGFLQSLVMLFWIGPKLVVSKGGSGSAVVTLAARMLGIPMFIHESDTIPGQSNRLAYPWAKKVFTSFTKTAYFDPTKVMVTGNPILKELQEGNKENARDIFNLTGGKPLLLFLGGSQGAQPLNDFILDMLSQLLQSYEVIHVCGKKNYTQVKSESEVILTPETENYYHLWEFLQETPMKHALAAADFIISRAGSGSIFEIAASGKPAILIPLPSSANNHQSKNAFEYSKSGAAVVIEQANLSPNFFLERLDFLFSDSAELKAMSKAALAFARPLAAKAIAREILEYLHIQ